MRKEVEKWEERRKLGKANDALAVAIGVPVGVALGLGVGHGLCLLFGSRVNFW